MSDRGAKALAERLALPDSPPSQRVRDFAVTILGEHGLFIPDVSGHEPIVAFSPSRSEFVKCICGWEPNHSGGLQYFDHFSR